MVCKVMKGMSMRGLIDYVTNENKSGRIIASKGVLTDSIQTIVDCFGIQCSFGTSKTKYVAGHFALSWMKEERDRMTPQFMGRLAEEFMEMIGYSDTQYIVTEHTDTAHPHCHIAFNRIGNDGKALNDSYLHQRAIRACRALEDKYNLMSNLTSDLKNVNENRLRGKAKAKFKIKKTALNLARQSHSWRDFCKSLSKDGIRISFRYNKDGGIVGVIFSDGKQSFGGSKLHKELSLKSLDKRFGDELLRTDFGKSLPEYYKVPILFHTLSVNHEGSAGHAHQGPQIFAKSSIMDMPANQGWGAASSHKLDAKSMQDAVKASTNDIATEISEDIILVGSVALEFLLQPTEYVDINVGGGGSSSYEDEDKDKKRDKDDETSQRPIHNVYKPKRRR